MFTTERVIVLRVADYRENSRMLTLLTERGEKISAAAHGRKAYAEPFVCSELSLREYQHRKTVTEGRTLSEFRGLRNELERFECAAHICRVLEQLGDSDVPEPALYRLGVRALHTLSTLPPNRVPALRTDFENRAARLMGFGSYAEIVNSE